MATDSTDTGQIRHTAAVDRHDSAVDRHDHADLIERHEQEFRGLRTDIKDQDNIVAHRLLAAAIAAVCSGVDPQQLPAMLRKPARANSSIRWHVTAGVSS